MRISDNYFKLLITAQLKKAIDKLSEVDDKFIHNQDFSNEWRLIRDASLILQAINEGLKEDLEEIDDYE